MWNLWKALMPNVDKYIKLTKFEIQKNNLLKCSCSTILIPPVIHFKLSPCRKSVNEMVHVYVFEMFGVKKAMI